MLSNFQQNLEIIFCPYNPVIINWPEPIMTFTEKNFHPCFASHHRQKIINYLFRKMPIRKEVIFIFKLVCYTRHEYTKHPHIFWSVWEAYKFPGESTNENISTQEIFYSDASSQTSVYPIRTKVQRRKDFQQTVIRAVAPVWSKYLKV